MNFLKRYATPVTTGLFLVSLISGIALFFHVGQSWFHGMHEWLSMALIIPFLLHIWKNWRAFAGYFKRAAMPIALGASVLAAAAFIVPLTGQSAAQRSGPPQFSLANAVAAASPAVVAPVFALSPDDLVARLKEAGFTSADAEMPLKDIAATSGKNQTEIFGFMAGLVE